MSLLHCDVPDCPHDYRHVHWVQDETLVRCVESTCSRVGHHSHPAGRWDWGRIEQAGLDPLDINGARRVGTVTGGWFTHSGNFYVTESHVHIKNVTIGPDGMKDREPMTAWRVSFPDVTVMALDGQGAIQVALQQLRVKGGMYVTVCEPDGALVPADWRAATGDLAGTGWTSGPVRPDVFTGQTDNREALTGMGDSGIGTASTIRFKADPKFPGRGVPYQVPPADAGVIVFKNNRFPGPPLDAGSQAQWVSDFVEHAGAWRQTDYPLMTLDEFDPNVVYEHGAQLPDGWQAKFDRDYEGDRPQIQGAGQATFDHVTIRQSSTTPLDTYQAPADGETVDLVATRPDGTSTTVTATPASSKPRPGVKPAGTPRKRPPRKAAPRTRKTETKPEETP